MAQESDGKVSPIIISPSKPRLMTHAERIAAYGEPATLQGGLLKASARWESTSLVSITVPWPTSQTGQRLKVHHAVADDFRALFDAWKAAGLLPYLLSCAGAHNTRMKRGKEKSKDLRDLSTHSFGAAMDVNAAWNPFGKLPAPKGTHGSVAELVPIAHQCGFVWGGDFSGSSVDGMHFERGVLPGT